MYVTKRILVVFLETLGDSVFPPKIPLYRVMVLLLNNHLEAGLWEGSEVGWDFQPDRWIDQCWYQGEPDAAARLLSSQRRQCV